MTPKAVGAVGALGAVLLVIGTVLRATDFVPAGLAFGGACYLLVVLLGDGAVDLRAPFVAAALLLAAELAYSAFEPPLPRAPAVVRLRRLARTGVLVLAGSGAAAVVLLASITDVGSPAVLAAVGVLASVGALALLAVLARTLT